MKKAFAVMFALLTIPMAMQAQTKFHDVEANEASGPVKSIQVSIMGNTQTIEFGQDGKMLKSEGMSDMVYDADGFLQTAKLEGQGMVMTITYKWEGGKVTGQTIDMGGQAFTVSRVLNDKGAAEKEIINMGGQEMETPYTDYVYDDHGNWISRKGSMMGQEMVQTRTITYYE